MQDSADDDPDDVAHLSLATSASWEHVARDAVRGELYEGRSEVMRTFGELEDALRRGEPLDASDVKDARQALNQARRTLEHHVATVADGTGAWDSPIPSMPAGRYREVVGVTEDDRSGDADR